VEEHDTRARDDVTFGIDAAALAIELAEIRAAVDSCSSSMAVARRTTNSPR
jgi:hypothetical protein